MVDYKKVENKSQFLCFRDKQISKIDILLKDWTDSKYKNSVLLSYWLKDYEKFLRSEDSFKCQKSYFKYKRGQILFVNFGYRVGHELGGNHYCIVVSKNDSLKSSTLTVVPLRTYRNKINENLQVLLDDSLQWSIANQINKTLNHVSDKVQKNKTFALAVIYIANKYSEDLDISVFENLKNEADSNVELLDFVNLLEKHYLDKNHDEFFKVQTELLDFIEQDTQELEKRINYLTKSLLKAKKLNKNTIADVHQITTISKSRIINPTRKNDTLLDVILNKQYLDLINNKIKNLFVFDK
ncbi:MAG: type II toxin-antitoxin system PemK/MazF family toxin [Peptoniphilus sp.]|uniref:type II toxin-antitoxin system PemK/MazF family toxin n=1 Tax=Peptoniphilus sp. TaxID=1971214 RepID=UPI002A765A44|nr:type II toxin-antitoxin system PemK/MazF family toxin [Peptoniphilus sp.]MDY2986104.1 type II toxin-antitoxin system PemK/MazF family toxin [Peptoniphilus sp.]